MPYFIQDYPNVVGFLIFKTLCLGRSKTLAYVWKKYHKNEMHLCLVIHIFTKLSQNECLINVQILVYQHDKCWLWKIFFFFTFCVTGNPNLDFRSCCSVGKNSPRPKNLTQRIPQGAPGVTSGILEPFF